MGSARLISVRLRMVQFKASSLDDPGSCVSSLEGTQASTPTCLWSCQLLSALSSKSLSGGIKDNDVPQTQYHILGTGLGYMLSRHGHRPDVDDLAFW